ncbi:ankyrin unc44 [Phlyctema vagabunda]|uniref:Ankyrin unc44 n=1 Tax=Phlyctema vagabunda TaxID=108571 RepID=A0ABR4PNJ5_9HELO
MNDMHSANEDKTADDSVDAILGGESQATVLVDTTDSYLDAEHKFDIVTIHGLHGSSKKSWASETQSSWLKGLAISQKWEARIITYGWNKSDLTKSLYTRRAIKSEAYKLLQKLAELRKGQYPPLPLAFFAHDIGGIILKEALFLAGQYHGRFVNIKYSTRFLVFDDFITRFGTASEWIFEIERTHRDLDHEPDPTFYNLDIVMQNVATFPWREDGISPFIESIESRVAMINPLQSLRDSQHRFSWLSENETFLDWKDREDTSFLHINGSSDVTEAAQYVYFALNEGREKEYFKKVLYFKFDRYDIHRNSIGAMANTFLSQIMSACRESPASLIGDFEPPDFEECWTGRDALTFLMKTRIGLGNAGRVAWILDGFDQCDQSSILLLDEILCIASSSEQYFKILITSVDNKRIHKNLSSFHFIDIQEQETKPLAGNVECVKDLIQDLPQLCDFESEIVNLIESCGTDTQMRRLVLNWLRHLRLTPGRALERQIREFLVLSPENISQRVLSTIDEDTRPWARKVLTLILFSLRPITFEELGSALAMDAPDVTSLASDPYPEILEELSRSFGPLLTRDNGVIEFAHPSIRDILLHENLQAEKNTQWYLLDSPEDAHKIIVDICIQYLSLTGIQAQILTACKISPTAYPILQNQSNFLSYAIKFWPQHLQLGYKSAGASTISESVTRFLEDSLKLQHWAAANWYTSNPNLRSDRSFLSSLPILAALGLDEMLAHAIASLNSNENATLRMALMESARYGHHKVVRVLLNSKSIDQMSCIDAMLVAARSAEFDILRTLLHFARKEFKEVHFPQMLLSRAAYFGEDGILQFLIENGLDVNPTGYSGYSLPLYCAILRNNISTVQLLLQNHANHTAPNTRWKDTPPIVVAAKYGHANIIKMLLEAGTSVDGKDSDGRPAIWWAALLGQHEAVQALIHGGADKSAVEIGLTEALDYPILFSVVRVPRIKICRALLLYGVDPNIPKRSTYPTSTLGLAALNGNVDTCRLLVEYGADINGCHDDKPIIHGVFSKKREMVDFFLEKEADVDVKIDTDQMTSTPLIAAAEINDNKIAAALLENNATIDLALSSGKTALHYAADEGNPDMIKLLIEAGADTSIAAFDRGWGMLHRNYDRVDCLKVLLDGGADVDATCIDGTCLYLAAYHGCLEEVKLLIARHANLELTSGTSNYWDDGCTPLHAAAALGFHEIVRALLDGGANANAKSPKGFSPLILATSNRRDECVKALLDYSIDLEAATPEGFTAVYFCHTDSHLPIARMLVNRGANLKHRNKYGYTPLCEVVLEQRMGLVAYLLERKAEINTTGSMQGGPMHIAASNGNIDMLKLLIQNGGDINLVEPEVGTPLSSFFLSSNDIDHEPVLRYLLEEAGANVNVYGGNFGSILNASFLRSEVENITPILEKGVDVNYPDNFGRRPIHYASMRTTAHVQLLLDAGVDVKTKTKIGQLPLHFAVVSGNLELIELILTRTNVSINEPDEDGWTPLMWACRISDNWGAPSVLSTQVIELLLSHGADLWVRGRSTGVEWSPLKVARYHDASDEVVKLLIPQRQTTTSKDGENLVWDPEFHTSRPANRTNGFCDICLFGLYGVHHACIGCADPFCICFKCWGRKDDFHPQHDSWELCGMEYKSVEEEIKAKDEDEKDDETSMVEQIEDDDDQGDWSNDDDEKKGH